MMVVGLSEDGELKEKGVLPCSKKKLLIMEMMRQEYAIDFSPSIQI